MINTTPLMRHLTQGLPNRPIKSFVEEWNTWVPGTSKASLDQLEIDLNKFSTTDWKEYNAKLILVKPYSKLAVWIHLKTPI